MEVLKTQGVTKLYGGKAAVDNVTLSVHKGDIFGLIGQNGAGKTTLMRMAASLTWADSGHIELFGESRPAEMAAARTRMGSVIEIPALYGNLTAHQNLEYYRRLRGINDKSRINEALQRVGLTDTGNKKFKNFSLGMKQRLGLAVAILGQPEFLILDEPINGLDPTGIVEMREFIRQLNKEGITILISSHILTELAQVATRYAIIHHGKLLKLLTQAELLEDCKQALLVVVDNATKAGEVLESTLGIRDYERTDDTHLRIYEHVSDPAEVTFRLNQAGVRVASIQEVGDGLEEYYTNIIGGGTR